MIRVHVFSLICVMFGGMMFGHSMAKYARRKKHSMLIGTAFLLAAVALTMLTGESTP